MKLDIKKVEIFIAKSGMSITEFSIATGCGCNLVSRIRHGRNLNTKTVKRVADCLGVEVEEIVAE